MKRELATYQAHDHWWWRNPKTKEVYGPFNKRDEARDHARKIRAAAQDVVQEVVQNVSETA